VRRRHELLGRDLFEAGGVTDTSSVFSPESARRFSLVNRLFFETK
jgi:hypothetical protein